MLFHGPRARRHARPRRGFFIIIIINKIVQTLHFVPRINPASPFLWMRLKMKLAKCIRALGIAELWRMRRKKRAAATAFECSFFFQLVFLRTGSKTWWAAISKGQFQKDDDARTWGRSGAEGLISSDEPGRIPGKLLFGVDETRKIIARRWWSCGEISRSAKQSVKTWTRWIKRRGPVR